MIIDVTRFVWIRGWSGGRNPCFSFSLLLHLPIKLVRFNSLGRFQYLTSFSNTSLHSHLNSSTIHDRPIEHHHVFVISPSGHETRFSFSRWLLPIGFWDGRVHAICHCFNRLSLLPYITVALDLFYYDFLLVSSHVDMGDVIQPLNLFFFLISFKG